MQTIILAAGNNERFKGQHKSGLKAPDGRSFLENQVESLDADPVIFIAQKKYAEILRPAVHKLSFMNGNSRTIVHAWLVKETTGPIDTLYKATDVYEFLRQDEPVLITYCDVMLPEKYVKEFIEKCNHVEAGAVVFASKEDRFQDAIPGSYKFSGLFYFKTAKKLILMAKTLSPDFRGSQNGIPDLVKKVKSPMFFVLDQKHIVDIGTPEAYKEWIND